jgi:hypothetical protein
MDYTIYIDQYLDNELSPEERQAFETALASDETLQKNLSQEQAIREQFAFEKTKLSVLALHQQKKKKAEQERLIQEQFDFEKTKKEVLALHERKKAEKKEATPQKEAKIVAMPQKNNWYRYAIAASMIGLMLTGAWLFIIEPDKPSIPIVVIPPPVEPTTPPLDTTKQEEKAIAKHKTPSSENIVVVPKKPKQIIQEKPQEENLASVNPMLIAAFDNFYTAQMKDVKTEVMSGNDSNTFENATINLKNGKTQAAYKQLATLHEEKPNDADVILFFALAAYKMDKKEEAIKLLESIKEKNKDVAEFLEKIK